MWIQPTNEQISTSTSGKGETPTTLARRACTLSQNFVNIYNSSEERQQDWRARRLGGGQLTPCKRKRGSVAVQSFSFLHLWILTLSRLPLIPRLPLACNR